MKKTVLASLAVLALASTAYAVPTIYPTGTTIYKPEKAYNGFVLIGNGLPRLVDMNGNLVKEWPGLTGNPNKALPGGQMMSGTGQWSEGQQDGLTLTQVDFEGRVLWEYREWEQVPAIKGEPSENGKTWISRQHHDFQRKGTPVYHVPGQGDGKGQPTLILGHYNERDERINKAHQLLSDVFFEVGTDGKILWQWRPTEHLDELGYSEAAFKAMQSYPPVDNPVAGRHAGSNKTGVGFDWFHVNSLSYLGPNKWYDQDPAKYAMFHPDNIMFNSRESNIMGIVDRKNGKVAWRLGPDYGPGSPDAAIGQVVGAHSVHIIPKGLPGEGNVLFFDNGGTAGYGEPNPSVPVTGFHNARRDYSRVVEFDPITKKIVWEYNWFKNNKGIMGHFNFKFFSPFVSNVQRLPNGNTMITEGDMGRVFEITADYELVWEYLPPYSPDGVLYRTYRVPYDWFPQIQKPEEVSVTPLDKRLFQLPNDKGVYPNVGIEGQSVKLVQTDKVIQNSPAEPAESEEPQGMHAY